MTASPATATPLVYALVVEEEEGATVVSVFSTFNLALAARNEYVVDEFANPELRVDDTNTDDSTQLHIRHIDDDEIIATLSIQSVDFDPPPAHLNPSGQEEDDQLRSRPGELDFSFGYNTDGTARSHDDRIWY
jgi:hypothetical protein